MFFGIIILILGVAFLLKNLGILNEVSWSIVWPLILIVLGLVVIFKPRKWWE